jgi:hypothetical protein
MSFEIVEAYTIKNDSGVITGWSLHVYLIEEQIDLRGCFLKKERAGRLFLLMPYRQVMDEETKKMVKFPVISYTQMERQKNFIKELKEKAVEYIKTNKSHEMTKPNKKEKK